MPKVTRKGMARGTKVTRQAVMDPIQAVETIVEGKNIDLDNLSTPYAPFRINVHIPNIDSKFFQLAKFRKDALHWFIPFTLPPPQDLWSDLGVTSEQSPIIILDEVMISFDQGGEPAGIASEEYGSPADPANEGKLDYNHLEGYDITIGLHEKTPYYWGGAAPYTPERQVFSINLPPEAFSGRALRFNPFAKPGLAEQLNPYRTYLLSLHAPLSPLSSDEMMALPALTLSLKCRCQLLAHDVAPIQNAPTHQGMGTPRALNIQVPNAGGTISASGAGGVHTNLAALDDVLTSKVGGGYAYDGRVALPQDMIQDAAYEVILVPMWSNFGSLGVANAERADELPYTGDLFPYDTWTEDQRVIPLDFPMVVHHAFALVNYMQPRGMGSASTDALHKSVHPDTGSTFESRVGVGIGTGIRSDHVALQSVAYQEWSPGPAKAAITVDRVAFKSPSLLSEDTNEPWDWEILSIPLVRRGEELGVGYQSQGAPYYVGRSLSWTQSRTNSGNTDTLSATPNTEGCEEYLCVRWQFRNPNGLAPGYSTAVFSGLGNNSFELATIIEVANPGSVLDIPATSAACIDDTTLRTAQADEPAHGGFAATRSTWWQWTAPYTGNVTVDTEGSAVDTTLGVYTSADQVMANVVLVAEDDDSGTGTNSTVSFLATRGTNYYIAVDSKVAGIVHMNLSMDGGDATNKPNTVYAGCGGHFVEIIAKKMLANPNHDVRI